MLTAIRFFIGTGGFCSKIDDNPVLSKYFSNINVGPARQEGDTAYISRGADYRFRLGHRFNERLRGPKDRHDIRGGGGQR